MFTIIGDLLVGLIGKPILLLLKWFRWPLLFFGFYFNGISTYNPATGASSHGFTAIPFFVGLVLFCVGLTVKRYDEAYKDYTALCQRLDESLVGQHFLE